MNYIQSLLPLALQAAHAACKEILQVYNTNDFQTELKGDNSPLTIADKQAHNAIASILHSANLPVLSEEGKMIPYDERKKWEYFWMVDPLDGTKEFLKRNDEFTVNVALMHKNKPVLGVVAVPVSGDTYYTNENSAFVRRGGVDHKLPTRGRTDLTQTSLRVVASRSHMDDETKAFISTLQQPTIVSAGSSLKFMMLADGTADVYPRFAPTMEWDTAAAHAIVNAVGLKVIQQGSLKEVLYNKESLLNPRFLVS